MIHIQKACSDNEIVHVFHVSVLFTYQILDIFHPLPSFVCPII